MRLVVERRARSSPLRSLSTWLTIALFRLRTIRSRQRNSEVGSGVWTREGNWRLLDRQWLVRPSLSRRLKLYKRPDSCHYQKTTLRKATSSGCSPVLLHLCTYHYVKLNTSVLVINFPAKSPLHLRVTRRSSRPANTFRNR